MGRRTRHEGGFRGRFTPIGLDASCGGTWGPYHALRWKRALRLLCCSLEPESGSTGQTRGITSSGGDSPSARGEGPELPSPVLPIAAADHGCDHATSNENPRVGRHPLPPTRWARAPSGAGVPALAYPSIIASTSRNLSIGSSSASRWSLARFGSSTDFASIIFGIVSKPSAKAMPKPTCT